MPTLETLIVFSLAVTVMNISPGPSNLSVLSRTVSQGWAGGVTAALGLAVLFQYSPTAYLVLKLSGAAHLIYLGVRYFVQK